ncbi:MAG: GAF domain-containing protein [Anaerolineales bacterium]|nr:GAF domain-containing protein [Anaerolineales bacterium]
MENTTSALRFLQQENARLQEENKALREDSLAFQRYIEALQDLYWATQRITSEENLFNLLDQILHNAMGVLRAEDGSLLLLDEETNELVFVLVHGDIRNQLRGYRIKSDSGIAGWVVSHREPLIVNNPRQDSRFSLDIDEEFSFVTRSILCVPMIARAKLIGVIELLNKRDDEFREADATLLLILAQVAAIALEEMQTRLEAEEAKLA